MMRYLDLLPNKPKGGIYCLSKNAIILLVRTFDLDSEIFCDQTVTYALSKFILSTKTGCVFLFVYSSAHILIEQDAQTDFLKFTIICLRQCEWFFFFT